VIILVVLLFIIPSEITPQAQTVNNVRFAAAGDWDCTVGTEATISAIQKHEVDAVLALGDLAYTVNNANCWFAISEPIDDKIKFVLGNHDDENDIKYEQYMSHYELRLPYYSFEIGDVHFLILSTEASCETCPFTTSEPQYAFASEDLSSASRDPNISWLVVSMHKPLYTNLHPGHNDYNIFKRIYQPLFDKHEVDLVLAGHVHNYQRTPPLKYNPSNPSSPTVTDDSFRTFYNPEGQIYLVVGTGGRVLAVHQEVKPYRITYEEDHHGFLLVETQETLTTKELYGKFYVNGQYPSGADNFSIIKPNFDHFGTGFEASGSNSFEITSNSTYQLTQYSLAVQFNTCENRPAGNYFLVNKGGVGTDAPGKNLNYGMWLNGAEQLRAGFESLDGTDYIVTANKSYNDCRNHYAINTFDGSSLMLYVDGHLVASQYGISQNPDNTGSQPIRVGANSLMTNSYFIGNIDEVRLFNTTMTEQQVKDATFQSTFMLNGDLLYLSFD
jgi:predicted phosphodiesterase